jgi:hypothetical protein
VEIVSPGNKDRAEGREAFVSKCHALLQQDVCVAIVDLVTERQANLYVELAARIGAAPPALAHCHTYAVSCQATNPPEDGASKPGNMSSLWARRCPPCRCG